MVKIFLIRHGHSTGNERAMFTGNYDCDLSATGYKQAELLGKYIYENLKVDAIISSDLIRAVNTVKPTANLLSLPIIRDSAFRELSMGEWEGILFSEAERRDPKIFKDWIAKVAGAYPPSGETWESLLERSLNRLNSLMTEYEGKNIILCAHGGVIKVLECYILGKPLTEMGTIDWVPNASITELHYSNGKYEICGASIDGYLFDLKTELPKTL